MFSDDDFVNAIAWTLLLAVLLISSCLAILVWGTFYVRVAWGVAFIFTLLWLLYTWGLL